MSERTTTTPTEAPPKRKGTRTAGDASAAPGSGSSGTAAKTDTGPITVAPDASAPVPPAADAPPSEGPAAVGPETPAPGIHATKPVTARPKVRSPRRGPLTRMGPWAPVAGALIGLLAGVLVVVLLLGAADGFADRLALVLTVVGLGLVGAGGTLLADEVRMIRLSAREAAVRPAWVEATAPLLRGMTPARLLLLMSAFVLFLAAYVTR